MARINVENLIIDRHRIVNNIETMFGCRKEEAYEPSTPVIDDPRETIVIDTDNLEL